MTEVFTAAARPSPIAHANGSPWVNSYFDEVSGLLPAWWAASYNAGANASLTTTAAGDQGDITGSPASD